MDGLEELTLVFPNPGVVWLLHQPGVFVDEPRLPENVSSGIFHLARRKNSSPFHTRGNGGTARPTCQGQLVSCTWLPGPIIPASHCMASGGAVAGHTVDTCGLPHVAVHSSRTFSEMAEPGAVLACTGQCGDLWAHGCAYNVQK